jgi:small-conductance mechanosensitive channel
LTKELEESNVVIKSLSDTKDQLLIDLDALKESLDSEMQSFEEYRTIAIEKQREAAELQKLLEGKLELKLFEFENKCMESEEKGEQLMLMDDDMADLEDDIEDLEEELQETKEYLKVSIDEDPSFLHFNIFFHFM